MGWPKAWLDVAGEPLLARVVRTVRAVVAPVMVVAAPGQSLPPLDAAIMTVHDALPGRGPLQGMAAGFAALEAAAAPRCDAVFVTSCDVPWLTAGFIRRMVDLLGDHEVAVPVIDGQPYPLSGVYRLTLHPVIERLLAEDRRSPRALIEGARYRAVTRAELADVDPELFSLKDLSTPEDYKAARRSIAS
jgi:molybdopterin-guanine dinucleotide biosynthesis protein A